MGHMCVDGWDFWSGMLKSPFKVFFDFQVPKVEESKKTSLSRS